MSKFKNPALQYVDGVLTGHCIMCAKYIGNEYDTSYYALIKRRYCPECAEISNREKARFRAANNRHNHATVKAEWQRLVDEYRVETQLQRQIIAELRDELERIKG